MSIPPYSAPGWKPSQILGKEEQPGLLSWDDVQYNLALTLQLPDERWVNDPEDEVYILPTQEDINDLLSFYRHRRENLDYLPDGWDCDNYASEMKYWADVWGVRRYSKSAAAVMVGKLYVHLHGNYDLLFPGLKGREVDAYHVLNFIMRSDGKLFFFEPQSGILAPADSFIYEDSLTVMRVEY